MDSSLIVFETTPGAGDLVPLVPVEELIEEARAHTERARARNTLRAYAADWRDFERWCVMRGVMPLPATATTLCLYFTERARTLKTNSLGRRLAAIAAAHRDAGHEDLSPTRSAEFKTLWKGIRRSKGVAVLKKAPAFTADIRRMIEALPAGRVIGARDRALLLVGFAGALRRSELVGLDVEDLSFVTDGLVITLRHSKTDQEGEGALVPIPYGSNPQTCPVRATRQWLELVGITSGAVFRPINRWGAVAEARLSADAIPHIVRSAARAAGLEADRFGGHSLRAGFASAAAFEDVPERDAMAHMRQKSVAVHRGYVRAASLFRRNPASRLGL